MVNKYPKTMIPVKYGLEGLFIGIFIDIVILKVNFFQNNMGFLIFLPVFSLIGFSFYKCTELKKKLNLITDGEPIYIQKNMNKVDYIDKITLERNTNALLELGFIYQGDFQYINNNIKSGFGYSRYFINNETNCIATIYQVFHNGKENQMRLSFRSYFDNDWTFGTMDSMPPKLIFANRLKKSLLIIRPSRPVNELYSQHLFWVNNVITNLKVNIKNNITLENYFEFEKCERKKRQKLKKEKNILFYLYEIDKVEMIDKYDWLDCYYQAVNKQ